MSRLSDSRGAAAWVGLAAGVAVALLLVAAPAAGAQEYGFVAKWGSLGSGDGQFGDPEGIATDQAGNVYVADTNNRRIQKFTSDGQFIARWGSPGTGDGQFAIPRSIVTDQAGNVYVSDAGNARIQKFTSDGQFLAKWGSAGTGDGQFRFIDGITTDQAGNVYVGDTGHHRIQKFTSDGQFIAKLGSPGTGDGQVAFPWGIATDQAGNVYVVDASDRVQKFAILPDAGRTAVARVLSGTVLVSRGSIRQARAQASQGSDLVPLTGPTVLAIGALVDASRGALELLTAANLNRATQKGEFSNGKFRLRQKRSSKPTTDVVLNEKLRCGKAKTGSRSRSLDANARGRYRVVGRFATGSPQGRARWTTRDTCTATSIKVQEGKVTVRDLVKRRNVVVKKGRSYRARKSR